MLVALSTSFSPLEKKKKKIKTGKQTQTIERVNFLKNVDLKFIELIRVSYTFLQQLALDERNERLVHKKIASSSIFIFNYSAIVGSK